MIYVFQNENNTYLFKLEFPKINISVNFFFFGKFGITLAFNKIKLQLRKKPKHL